MAEHGSVCCGACRFLCCSMFHCICCKDSPPDLPVYNVICIGITNSGKSTLLKVLTHENSDTVVPTVGFNVKDIRLPNAVLKVKELGGGDNIRPYWGRYYTGVQGVVFVIDGMSTHDKLEELRPELMKALNSPELRSKPWLILCNKQDLEGASTDQSVIEELQLRSRMKENESILVKSCSKTNVEGLRLNFESFGNELQRFYANEVGPMRV
ncbi:ADP-ribosylation factor-like protein 15 [Ciona intestinalis]